MTVGITVLGIPCVGLIGRPALRHLAAFSVQVETEVQAASDRLWRVIVSNGGHESDCGWCKDRRGISW